MLDVSGEWHFNPLFCVKVYVVNRNECFIKHLFLERGVVYTDVHCPSDPHGEGPVRPIYSTLGGWF